MQPILSLQLKISSEVKFSYLFVFRQLFGGSLFKDLSLDQQIGPVTNRQCFSNVMICYQYADVFIFQPSNDRLNIFHRNGVNACEGFVEQNKFWVNGKGSCDFCPSPFTPAQQIAVTFTHMMKSELIQQRLYFFSLFRFAEV